MKDEVPLFAISIGYFRKILETRILSLLHLAIRKLFLVDVGLKGAIGLYLELAVLII